MSQNRFTISTTNGSKVPIQNSQLSDKIAAVVIAPEKVPPSWMFWRKRRYIIVLLAFLGTCNIYTLRVNLSVGIVAMTDIKEVVNSNGTITHVQHFTWNSKEKGLILSSFFYGYILTQFAGGYFGTKIGGNWGFGCGIGITALFTLLTPLAAKTNVTLLIVVRVIEGLAEGITYPCIHAVWSRWSPPKERSRMATITFAGGYAGTVVAMSISGMLAESFGWESLFYIFGTIGIIWFVVWMAIVREDPAKDRYISKDELRYIQQCLNQTETIEKLVYPWRAIFTSPAVYAICAAHFSESWGFYTLLTQLPSFLRDTMHYDLRGAGFLSAAPYLAVAILLGIAGYFADLCQVKGWLTTKQVRRYYNCSAFVSQTVFMMIAAYVLHPIGSIVCIIIAVGLGAFALAGFGVNHLDIAPQYACILMGISNTFGTMPGIITPTLTGYLVQNKTAAEWQVVFYISSGIYLFGAILFWIFASGEVQSWAKPKQTEAPTKDPTTHVKSIMRGHVNEGADLKD